MMLHSFNINIGFPYSAVHRINKFKDGISTYTYNLISELNKLNVKTNLIGSQYNNNLFNFIINNNLINNNKSINLFHNTDYYSFCKYVPNISTVYDTIYISQTEYCNNDLRRLKNSIITKNIKKSSHIITISNYSKNEIIDNFKINNDDISIIPCGINQNWLEEIEHKTFLATLKNRGLKSGYFLVVGIISIRKNIKRILNAHNTLPKSVRLENPLVFIGKMDKNNKSFIDLFNIKIENKEAFWFDDVYSEIELRHFYKGALACVYVSLFEGFGIPILEAFSSRVPVITSNTTSVPEVSSGIGYEINPENIEEIGFTMMQIKEYPVNIERINKGYDRACLYSWNSVAMKTLEVYTKFC